MLAGKETATRMAMPMSAAAIKSSENAPIGSTIVLIECREIVGTHQGEHNSRCEDQADHDHSRDRRGVVGHGTESVNATLHVCNAL